LLYIANIAQILYVLRISVGLWLVRCSPLDYIEMHLRYIWIALNKPENAWVACQIAYSEYCITYDYV
jgi:hypothetical protein